VIEALPVPRTRKGFRTQVFERYQRRQAHLDTAISEMFVYGSAPARSAKSWTPSPVTAPARPPSRGSFTAWTKSSKLGRARPWKPIRPMSLPMAPTSAWSMTARVRKCRF
jgi:hypothetical protein